MVIIFISCKVCLFLFYICDMKKFLFITNLLALLSCGFLITQVNPFTPDGLIIRWILTICFMTSFTVGLFQTRKLLQ